MTHTTVLHVDGDSALLETSVATLEAATDWSVLTATTVSAGRARLEADAVDCVVSEYAMPEMDGVEFLDAVRAEWPDLPFILFTGHGSETVASDAIAAGVTDYIPKGAGVDQYSVLVNRVENAVTQYRTARALERRRRQHEAVARLGRQALEASSVETLVSAAVDVVDDCLGTGCARVFRHRPEDGVLVPVASTGWPEANAETPATDQPSLAVHTVETGTSLVAGDARADPRGSLPSVFGVDEGSSTAVPLGSADDPWGVLTVHSDGRRSVTDEDVAFIEHTASVLGAAIERRQAEQREFESDERFREIADLSPDGIFRTDTSGQFTYVSPSCEATLGVPAGELLETSFEMFVTPESADDAIDGLTRVLEGETVVQLELRLVDGDGEPFDAEVSATPIQRGGETVCVQGFARDVTARKRRERALQHSRDLFESIVENFPNGGVFLVDRDLRFTVVGGDELELGGLSPEAMLGKRPSEVFPPGNAAVLEANYRAALNGERRSFEDSYQGRHYHDQMIPIRDAEGVVVAALSIAQNITRRVQDRAELERQNRRLDEFASAVSHDLRGPLNVAQGRLALACTDCDSEHLDAIARANDRMEELIDSLLSLARQGRTVGETAVLDLETVVEECWETVRTDGCRLDVAATCRLRADASRFRQLFENVVRNAVEHGAAGTEPASPLTVRVGVLPGGFYVEDDGPGVEDGRRDTIFERSVTTKAQGTGFGLAMVAEIADAHGWTISATDSTEGGLRLEVTGVSLVA